MSQSRDLQRHLYGILEIACATLDDASISYAVAGGIAAGFWGETRSTIDVDLVIAVSLDEVERVKKIFADDPDFLFDPNDFAFPDAVVIRVPQPNYDKDKPEIIAIDLLVYKDGFSQAVIARRRLAQYGAGNFWFCTPEDLILMKLRASRHRDLGDIQTILNVRGDELDLEYISSNTGAIDKEEVWQELIDEWRGSQ